MTSELRASEERREELTHFIWRAGDKQASSGAIGERAAIGSHVNKLTSISVTNDKGGRADDGKERAEPSRPSLAPARTDACPLIISLFCCDLPITQQ